jgi:hypothetical protein
MVRADVLYLVSETPEARGVFDEVNRTKRMVYCEVRSVGMSEVYEAKGHDLNPEYVFDLSDYTEYNGEKLVEYNGVLYDVFRTYVNGQKIEITVTRRD